MGIYYDLENKNYKNMSIVLNVCFCILSFLYTMFGVFGYICLADKLHGNLLLSDFGPQSFDITSSRVVMTIIVILSLPYKIFPLRETIFSALFPNKTIDTIEYK